MLFEILPQTEGELTSVAAFKKKSCFIGAAFSDSWLPMASLLMKHNTQRTQSRTRADFKMACQIIFYLIFSDVLEAEK